MLDFTAYLAAQHLTREAAREALPNAPVQTLQEPAPARRAVRLAVARRRISLTLRRLADRVEPAPECGQPAMAGR